MGRIRLLLVLMILPLLMLGVGGDAFAAFVWEEVGPGSARKGLEAVAVDPIDPQVVWATDGSRVWVTDDSGESWQVVLKTTSVGPRASRRSRPSPTRSASTTSDDTSLPSLGDELGSSEFRLRPLMDSDGDDEDGASGGEGAERRRSRRAHHVSTREAGTRLRVVGDGIYLCAQGGLWVADRRARNLGTDRRIRFGRHRAVFDVTDAGWGALWLSTDGGLLHLDVQERAIPVQGALGDRAVFTARVAKEEGFSRAQGQRLLIAAQDGLWMGQGRRFERVGISLGTPRDLVSLSPTQAVVATERNVTLVSMEPDRSPEVRASWPMADVHRLAVDRDRVLWAAGPGGIWSLSPDAGGSWEPQDHGLRDRRMGGLASSGGIVRLWIAGHGGLWRRVSERIQAERTGLRASAGEAQGAPGAWVTLEAAHRQRHAASDRLTWLRARQGAAWVLPDVNVSYTNYFARDETSLFVNELDQLLLGDVNIVDGRPEWRVMAYWDLYAAVLALLDLDPPDGSVAFQDEVRRVLTDRKELRDQVVPLYNHWVSARSDRAASGATDTRQALRQLLQIQRLEADLYAVTGGWFPVGSLGLNVSARSHIPLPILSAHQGE